MPKGKVISPRGRPWDLLSRKGNERFSSVNLEPVPFDPLAHDETCIMCGRKERECRLFDLPMCREVKA